MVFSFFTKKPEKMVARPSVNPRAKESLVPDSLDPSAQAAKTPAPRPSDNMPEEAISSGFSDFVFSEASANIQVEDELDPIDATAEEAAMLFSNAQNDAVRQTLESAVKSHRTGKAERLWLMLFDLHRLNGEQAAFEVLGIEFAGCFEKSPPGWKCRATTPPKQKAAEQAVRNLLFQGNLTEDNLDSIEAIANIFGKQPRLRLDLSKIERLDNAGCKQLLTVLQKARKARQDIELLGRDALARRVREQVRPGQASDPELDLLQAMRAAAIDGNQADFETPAAQRQLLHHPADVSTQRLSGLAAALGEVLGQRLVLFARGDDAAFQRGNIGAFAKHREPRLPAFEQRRQVIRR